MSNYKGSIYAEYRKKGVTKVNGRSYERQDVLQHINLGNRTPIVFSIEREEKGRFAVMDAKYLQPSHLGSSQNPLHFIPEAQPRNRSTSVSGALTPERIAKNLRPAELLEGLTAYSGAPIVNARGEVIQGNGRAYALKLYYDQYPNDPMGYREAIEAGNYRFGFLLYKEWLKDEGIKRPVLVRLLDVSDKEAIALGQFTQGDTEAVTTSTTKLKAKVRLLTAPAIKRIISELTRLDTSDDKSMAELVRESKVLTVLIKEDIIRPDDLENYTRNGSINETGVDFVSSLLLNSVFRSSDVNTPDVFTLLPVATQNAIKKSTIYLLRCTGTKTLNKDVSSSILAYREFLASGQTALSAWKNQFDLQGNSPLSRFSPLELALVELYHKSSTQKEIVSKFRQYATLVNPNPGNMFEPASKGLSKPAGVKKVFGALIKADTQELKSVRKASRTLRARQVRNLSKRRVSRSSEVATTSPTTDKTMNTKDKEAFKLRMAKGRALAAKKKKRKTTATKKAVTVKPKKAAVAKPKKSTAAKPKKVTMAKSKKAATPKKAVSTRKKATGLTAKKATRKVSALKKATLGKTTVRVKSRKDQQGANFIKEVDKLANRIHEKSATGKFEQVPVYTVSRSVAKARAFKALKATRGAKNVTNVRLKV